MIKTVVKIDLVGSKSFAQSLANKNPNIRTELIRRLLEVSQQRFPQGELLYPQGSFYKPEGDAAYFIVDKSSVALRAAIDFMQSWFSVVLPGGELCPDCRVIIERGDIQSFESSPGATDILGTPFENISVAEKSLEGGHVYVTEEVTKHCDPTMARFTLYRTFEPRANERIALYRVEFADPRTVEDSSLLHALFVAHPKAQAARDRVLELFLLEYLVENSSLTNFDDYDNWCRSRGYPVIPHDKTERIASSSENFASQGSRNAPNLTLTAAGEKLLRTAETEYETERQRCLEVVRKAILKATGSQQIVDAVGLDEVIDQYLAALFSEVRLMANYFRETFHLLEHDSRLFKKFDYILFRSLPISDHYHFSLWRTAIIDGLKQCCSENNGYIAAVFHNVLATYYLNRSMSGATFSTEKLKSRRLFIDTNVLYAMLVRASEQYEAVHYFVDRLQNIGVTLRIFPFTVEEYETSIGLVEKEMKLNGVSERLANWDPWLYKEYRANKAKYLNQIEICREAHSITKKGVVSKDRFDEIDLVLSNRNLQLEREYSVLTQDEVIEFWAELRPLMAVKRWKLDRYYDFLYESTKSPERMAHDCNCIQNIARASEQVGSDELGPRVMFITLDMQLARIRRKYPFVVSATQFVEFMLPYLFISDVPLTDASAFPNKLLSAQLATLLSKQQPDHVDILRGFFKNQDVAKKIDEGKLGPLGNEYANVLSRSRFADIVEEAALLPEPQQKEAAERLAALIDKAEKAKTASYFDQEGVQVAKLQRDLMQKERENRKLRRKIRFMKRTSSSES